MNMVLIFISLLVVNLACATRVPKADSPVAVFPVSTKFVGLWKTKSLKNLHKYMEGDIEIFEDPKTPGLLRLKSGGAINAASDKVFDDADGVKFHVILQPEVFLGGSKLVLASIWRKVDDKISEGTVRAISIIVFTYEVTANDELIFEKYGYSIDEPNGKFVIAPYSKQFPQNYHTVYTRSN